MGYFVKKSEIQHLGFECSPLRCSFLGYGLTETCGCGAVQDAYDITSGRVGGPLGSTVIKLVDWPEGNYFVKNDPPQGKFFYSHLSLFFACSGH